MIAPLLEVTVQLAIKGEYITLGQLLKAVGEIDSGGEVKAYLMQETPVVNGQPENRRGRKLYPGDVVKLKRQGDVLCVAE